MTLPTTLAGWLSHCERLHPAGIDLSLHRVSEVRSRLGLHFDVPVVTVAGTNGKGSTCAMLESIAMQAGYRVGLYTSPHLVDFEERCRVEGAPVAASRLLPHFAAVEAVRGDVPLTYFEFTTLAILRLLAEAGLDLVILEVGLGGRLDAVNVIDADCVVITSIDIDHVEYLGPDRESIGREKAHVMRPGRPAILSDPVPPESVIAHGQAIGADLWLSGRDFRFSGDRQQWQWAGRGQRYSGLGYPALRGANQLMNAAGVLAAFEALRQRLPVTAQAVRAGIALVDCRGASRSCPASQRSSWTWLTTTSRWPPWPSTWTRWATSRARRRCSVRCVTRMSRRCCGAWRRWSTNGIFAISTRRARRPPKPCATNGLSCKRKGPRPSVVRSRCTCIRALPRGCKRRGATLSPAIASSSLVPSTRSAPF